MLVLAVQFFLVTWHWHHLSSLPILTSSWPFVQIGQT